MRGDVSICAPNYEETPLMTNENISFGGIETTSELGES